MGKPALILIDLQKGMQTLSRPRNNPNAEQRAFELLARARDLGWYVVHVRHISRTLGSVFWPGQEGVAFQSDLMPLPQEHVVEKNVPDAFIHTGLERWLRVRGVEQLVMVGVSTENSVEMSARTAGNLGFMTTVVSDACFTFEKTDYAGRHRSAQEVHDMALSNLNEEYAAILTTAQVLSDGLSLRV
ncbi:MAG: cysteine hydrolase family protein [Formosimonas sp.]